MKSGHFKTFWHGLAVLFNAIIEDLLIFSGLGVSVYTTFRLDYTAGMYSLGACLLGLGVWFATHPKQRG